MLFKKLINCKVNQNKNVLVNDIKVIVWLILLFGGVTSNSCILVIGIINKF